MSLLTLFLLPGSVVLFIVAFLLLGRIECLPDRDQRIPMLKHRGFTHTFVFALLMGAGTGLASYLFASADPNAFVNYVLRTVNQLPVVALDTGVTSMPLFPDPVVFGMFGFSIGTLGIVSHIAGDIFTPSGIAFLWPITSKRYTLNWWNAASPVANKGLLITGWIVFGATLLLVGGRILMGWIPFL